jgi:hypothetical protein
MKSYFPKKWIHGHGGNRKENKNMTTETLVKVEYNMTIEEFKKHMTTIAKEINEITNTATRKWAIDKFINDLMTFFDNDTVSYVDGEVCNDYVNWDSNCGCSIIQASIDFKAIADYLIENDLEPIFDNVSDALCNLGERIECWEDVIDDNIHEINIDALEDLMSMDSEDKGKSEFITDFNEYKRKVANLTEREQIYDKLSKVLTEYEANIHDKNSDEIAADMYEVLVEIQRKWETDIANEN